MNIIITYQKVIKWTCSCNSDADGRICCSQEVSHAIELPFIPPQGSNIILDGIRHTVCEVMIDMDKIIGNNHDRAAIVVTCNDYVHACIPFYDYMKAFTHEYDSWKGKGDPTISESKNWKTQLPETFEEWEEDILVLKRYEPLSVQEKIKLSTRRCIPIS